MQEYKNLPLDIVYQGLSGTGINKIDSLKNGELVRNSVSFDIGPSEKMLVITGRYFPQSYSSSLNDLSAMVNKYSQMKSLKRSGEKHLYPVCSYSSRS